MKFDKSKVYTAVNADELKIGSKCIFANDLNDLRRKVQKAKYYILKLTAIEEDREIYRFAVHTRWIQDYDRYALAYLIEPPKESEYKPFESVDKAMKVIMKHGGYIHAKGSTACVLIVAYDNVYIHSMKRSLKPYELLDGYVFADDGSPCGELVEE